jgi:hypothetical protein
MKMLTGEQFTKARSFIFQQGRLIDKKRFLYHFSDGAKEDVLQALACYQNPDGGYAYGLELDVTCPSSTNICTEMAMFYLDELGVTQGEVVDEIEDWITTRRLEDRCLHPKDDILAYPHGGWWEDESGSSLSLIGMLGKWGRGTDALFQWAQIHYKAQECPEELGVYAYPRYLYLRFAPGAEKFSEDLKSIQRNIPAMLEKFAWHCPLLFHPFAWNGDDIDQRTIEAESMKAVATLLDDGGVRVQNYESIASYPVWRAVWTLDMLVTMKRHGLLKNMG